MSTESTMSTVNLSIGDAAPDFTLKDQAGNDVSLSSFHGNENVVVVFYPFTFSGICEGELCSLRDGLRGFQTKSAQVLAISCDSRHSQRIWSEQQGFSFPVLTDFWPHGEVAKAYGVFNDAFGCANRATFVIDKAGAIVATFASDSIGTPREQAEYDAAIAALS